MIARLRGTVLEASASRLVIDCNGVGYEVNVPESVAAELGTEGTEASLFTREVVREDDHSLYGFKSAAQRRLFDLLREVKGCGSRTSLSVIGHLGEQTAVESIATANVTTLIKVPGVGQRLADRIVVELRDKVTELQVSDRVGLALVSQRASNKPDSDVVAALIVLGYRRPEAEEAAEAAKQDSDDVQAQIRHALKRLSS